MQSDDPAFLPVGTEVSAKFKGAFCEAKVKKAVKSVKCKVALKEQPFGSIMADDTNIKGHLALSELVEVVQGKQTLKGQIQMVKDCSTYTVVFNDGDERVLKRTGLVLKSGKHFDSTANLDTMPLYNPESFVASLLGRNASKGKPKRRAANRQTPSNLSDESDEDEEGDPRNLRPTTSRIHNLRRSSSLTNVKSPDKSMRPPADRVRKIRESSVIAARKIAETPTGSTDDEQEEVGSRASGQRSITASPMFFLKRTRNASGKGTNSPTPLSRGRPKKNLEKTPTQTPNKVSSEEESEPEPEIRKTPRRTRQTRPAHDSDSEDEKETPKKVSPKTRSSNQESAHASSNPHSASTRSTAHRNLSEKDDPDEKEHKKPNTESLFTTPKKELKEIKEEAKDSKEPKVPSIKKTPPSPSKIEKRTMSSSSDASKSGTATLSAVFSKMIERADSPTKKDVEKKLSAQHQYEVGNVVLVHEYANPPSGRFYPAIIVSLKAYQANAKNAITIEKNCVPLRSFRNSKYLTSDLKHLTSFDLSTIHKLDDVQQSLQAAFDKANNFHTKNRLPGDWDIPSIYGPGIKKIPEKSKEKTKKEAVKTEIKEENDKAKSKPDEKNKEKEKKDTEKKEKNAKDKPKEEKLAEKPKEETTQKKEPPKSLEKEKEKVKEEKVNEKDQGKEKEIEEKKKEIKEKDNKDKDTKEKEKNKDKDKDKDKPKQPKKDDESSSEDSSTSEEEEESEEYNEKRDRFVAHFYKFQDESGNPMNRVPILGGKEIDLYRFYDVVTRMGGHKNVTQKQMWRKVLRKLKLLDCPGATTQTVKQSYTRYFSRFEDFMKQLGYGLLNEGVGASSSRTARSTRVLEFDWRKNVKVAKEKRAKVREAKEKSKDKEKSPSESSESKAPSVRSTTTTTSVTPSLNSNSNKNDRILSITPDLLLDEVTYKERKEKSPEKSAKDFTKEIKIETEAEKKSISGHSKEVKPGTERAKSEKPKEQKEKQPRERGPKRERKDSSSAIGSSDEEARKRYRRKKTEEGIDIRVRSPSAYSKAALESDVGYSNAHIFTRFYQGQKVHARHDSRFYDARVVTVKQPSLKDIAKTLMNAYHLGKITHSNYPDMEDITLQNLSVELKDVLKNVMNETKIFVHYLGWNSRYDEWLMLHMVRVDEKDEKNSSKAIQDLIPHELPPKLFAAAMDWCESPDGIQSLAHIHAYSGDHQRPRRLSSSSAASVGHHHRHHSTHSQSGASTSTPVAQQQILVATPGQAVQLMSQAGVQVVGSPSPGGTVLYQMPATQPGGSPQVVGIASPQWRPATNLVETQPLRTGTPVAIAIQPQTSSGSFSPAYQSQFVTQQSPRVERPPSAHVLVPPQPSASPTIVLATPLTGPLPRAGTPGQASLGGSSPASVSSAKFAVPPNVTVSRGIGSPPIVAPIEFTPPSTASTAPMLGSPLSEHGSLAGVTSPNATPVYTGSATSAILSPKLKSEAGSSTPNQQIAVEFDIDAKSKTEEASISVKVSSEIENVTTIKKGHILEETIEERETITRVENVQKGVLVVETKVEVTKEVADSSSIHPLVEELDEIEITIERTSIKDEDESGRNSVASSTATAKTIGSPAASTPRGGWARKRTARHIGPPAGVGDRKYGRTTDSSLASPRIGGETPRGGVDEEAETDDSSEFEDAIPKDSSHVVKHRMMQKMEAENVFDNYEFIGLSNLILTDDCEQNVDQIEERMRILKEIYQTTRLKIQKLEKRWKKTNEKRRQREREARHSKDAPSLKSPSSTSVTEEVSSTT